MYISSKVTHAKYAVAETRIPSVKRITVIHVLISEELKLESEEYVPTSCDKTCDQSYTVEIEDLGPI